jgi:hypothetical protein
MNLSIHEQEYAEMARPLESLPTETELLAQWGFNAEEIASLLL